MRELLRVSILAGGEVEDDGKLRLWSHQLQGSALAGRDEVASLPAGRDEVASLPDVPPAQSNQLAEAGRCVQHRCNRHSVLLCTFCLLLH